MSNLIRGLSENGGVVFCGVDSTAIVRKAEQLHKTSATCSAALGRLLTGSHDMDMVRSADHIVVLDEGSVQAEGNCDQVIKNSAYFAECCSAACQ